MLWCWCWCVRGVLSLCVCSPGSQQGGVSPGGGSVSLLRPGELGAAQPTQRPRAELQTAVDREAVQQGAGQCALLPVSNVTAALLPVSTLTAALLPVSPATSCCFVEFAQPLNPMNIPVSEAATCNCPVFVFRVWR